MIIARAAFGKTELFTSKRVGEFYDTIVGGSENVIREVVKTGTRQIYPSFIVNYDWITSL